MGVFSPSYGKTKTLSASSSSSQVAFDAGQHFVHITNDGPNTVFIRIGNGSQTATTADFPILDNESKTLRIGPSNTNMAGICAVGQTATVYITPGTAKT